MTDLWLISLPLDKTSLTSVEKLKHTITKTNQVSCCKFSIPDRGHFHFVECVGRIDSPSQKPLFISLSYT